MQDHSYHCELVRTRVVVVQQHPFIYLLFIHSQEKQNIAQIGNSIDSELSLFFLLLVETTRSLFVFLIGQCFQNHVFFHGNLFESTIQFHFLFFELLLSFGFFLEEIDQSIFQLLLFVL